jgi:hypothetical protein
MFQASNIFRSDRLRFSRKEGKFCSDGDYVVIGVVVRVHQMVALFGKRSSGPKRHYQLQLNISVRGRPSHRSRDTIWRPIFCERFICVFFGSTSVHSWL